jgi:hypothetical protein
MSPGINLSDEPKKITGRKRHILVDTLGMVLGIMITMSVSEINEGGVLEENEGARGWREVLRDSVPQTPWDLAHYACSGRG